MRTFKLHNAKFTIMTANKQTDMHTHGSCNEVVQSLYGTHYQSHLCLIVTYHILDHMYGCILHISSAIYVSFAIWRKLSYFTPQVER